MGWNNCVCVNSQCVIDCHQNTMLAGMTAFVSTLSVSLTLTRIHRWEEMTVFVSTLPDQAIDGPLSITMPFDKSRVEDFMHDIHPRILRWCAGQCHLLSSLTVSLARSVSSLVWSHLTIGQVSVISCPVSQYHWPSQCHLLSSLTVSLAMSVSSIVRSHCIIGQVSVISCPVSLYHWPGQCHLLSGLTVSLTRSVSSLVRSHCIIDQVSVITCLVSLYHWPGQCHLLSSLTVSLAMSVSSLV